MIMPLGKHFRLLLVLLPLLILTLSDGSALALNGDNDLDAVFANFNLRNRVCLGNGAGGFTCSDVSTDNGANCCATLCGLRT